MANQLSEIGFPEFTAKLITDTFNAITASYIDQMAQYASVVQVVSQTLQDYINNTRDDITADEINAFLVALGGLNDAALNFLLGDSTASAQLSQPEADCDQQRSGAAGRCRIVVRPGERRWAQREQAGDNLAGDRAPHRQQ